MSGTNNTADNVASIVLTNEQQTDLTQNINPSTPVTQAPPAHKLQSSVTFSQPKKVVFANNDPPDTNEHISNTIPSMISTTQQYTTSLEDARLKFQSLLDEDSANDQNEARLQFLLNNLEDAIHGQEILIPEDIIEYCTYLASDDSSLASKAFEEYIIRFEDKAVISAIGELKRPIIGDLLIDAFSDLIISCSSIDYKKRFQLMKLLSITSRITILRHGFTRLLQMYRWSITQTDAITPAEQIPVLLHKQLTFDSQKVPSAENLHLSVYFLDIMSACVKLDGPDIYLSAVNVLDTFDDRLPDERAMLDNKNSSSYLTPAFNNNNSSKQVNDDMLYEPLTPLMQTSANHLNKGWSYTSWFRMHKEQKVGMYDVISFQSIHSPYNGVRICIQIRNMNILAHHSSTAVLRKIVGSSLKTAFAVQCMPAMANQPVVIEDNNLTLGRWHFITFTHSVSRNYNFTLYIDGQPGESITLPFPTVNDGLLSLSIGGFKGDIGQSFFYEMALNEVTIKALYAVGATYNPPIYHRGSYARIAAFPRSIEQRAAPMQPKKYGYILLPFCYALNPRAVSEVTCLPYGWGELDVTDRTSMAIITHPHNKSAIISMGGICYIFYFLSPQFCGPKFYSDKQVSSVIRFFNELISNNMTLLRQLFTMGLSSIKIYILDFVPPPLRSYLVLNALKELLITITECDQDNKKTHFIQAFQSIIMDVPFWIRAPANVATMISSYIHTLVEIQSAIMLHCLSITNLFDMVISFFPNSFPSATYDTSKVPNDAELKVAKELLESVCAIVRTRHRGIKVGAHRAISDCISNCISADLKSELLSTYAEMCHSQPEIMFNQMSQKCGFVSVIAECLSSNHSRTRIKAAKILMGFIKYQKKVYNVSAPAPVVNRSGYVNKFALDKLIFTIGLQLGSLPSSMSSYTALLEIVLGKFKLTMPHIPDTQPMLSSKRSDSYTDSGKKRYFRSKKGNTNGNEDGRRGRQHITNIISSIQNRYRSKSPDASSLIPLVCDKDQINLIGALEGLMRLISVSKYHMRTRMLMDLLSLLKTSEYNQKLFCRQKINWDKWMVALISLESNDDANACNQLVSQITATVVSRFLQKEDKGWIAIMQLLESINRRILGVIREDKQRQQQMYMNGNDDGNNVNNNGKNGKPSLKKFRLSEAGTVQCRLLHDFLVQVLAIILNEFLMNHVKSHGKMNQKNDELNNLEDRSETLKV